MVRNFGPIGLQLTLQLKHPRVLRRICHIMCNGGTLGLGTIRFVPQVSDELISFFSLGYLTLQILDIRVSISVVSAELCQLRF